MRVLSAGHGGDLVVTGRGEGLAHHPDVLRAGDPGHHAHGLVKVLDQGGLREERGQELLEGDGPVPVEAGAPRQRRGALAAAHQDGVLADVLALQLVLLVGAGTQHRVGRHGAVVLGVVVGDQHGGAGPVVPRGGVLQLYVLHLPPQGVFLAVARQAGRVGLRGLHPVRLAGPFLGEEHARDAPVAGRPAAPAAAVLRRLRDEQLAHFPDLQQEAGHRGRGVVQLLFVGILAEHVIHCLTQLNKLPLKSNWEKHKECHHLLGSKGGTERRDISSEDD